MLKCFKVNYIYMDGIYIIIILLPYKKFNNILK